MLTLLPLEKFSSKGTGPYVLSTEEQNVYYFDYTVSFEPNDG